MSTMRSVKAVLWSFIGIRKGSESQEDMARVGPFQIVAVALVAVAIFVGVLIALVHWVVQ